jgi:hypothetical protein
LHAERLFERPPPGGRQAVAGQLEIFTECRVAIEEVKDAPRSLSWHDNKSSPFPREQYPRDRDLEAVMKNIADQTGLTVKFQKQKINVLVVTMVP